MNIYILRHGQTNYNLEGRFQGQINIEMNEVGKEQVKRSAEELKKIKFNKIFVSPLQRTISTARMVTKEKLTIEPRIIERSFGTLEGKHGIPNYEERIKEFDIESINDLQERVEDFLTEILQQSQEQDNILIVTHEGIAQIINGIFNRELPKKDWKKFRLGTGQYVKYVKHKNRNEY